jgi:hypothetical protein
VLLMGGERRLAFAVFGLSAAAFVVMLTR